MDGINLTFVAKITDTDIINDDKKAMIGQVHRDDLPIPDHLANAELSSPSAAKP